MGETGLILIICGWLIQLLQKKNKIEPLFVAVYAAGVLLLAIDGYSSGLKSLAFLNFLSLVIAVLVLNRAWKHKE